MKEQLRPEAQAVQYRELDSFQMKAFDRVTGLLSAAVEGVPPDVSGAAAAPSGRRPATRRTSRNILLQGGRGTGKTTLLLSLMRALDGGPPDPDDPAEAAGLSRSRRLIWLETLDMEPLAPSTNLLGALLARIESAVTPLIFGPDAAPSPVRLIGTEPHSRDVFREIIDLQTRVVSSFGSNLDARAGGLDPDNFAMESRRAERSRLGLPQAFADVLGRLAVEVERTARMPAPPLFVLPVDDLDLNPTGSFPLMELVRAVHSPHLIVIMLADLGVVRTVIELRYQKSFLEAGGAKTLESKERAVVQDLALNALRKHLPPDQRIDLDKVEPQAALTRFRPLEIIEGETAENRLFLRDVFCGCPFAADVVTVDDVVVGTRQRTLMQAMTTDGATPPPRRSWAEMFHLPARELVDLYLRGRHDDAATDVLARAARDRVAALTRSGHERSPEPWSVWPDLRWSADPGSEAGIESARIVRWNLDSPVHLDSGEVKALVGALDFVTDRDELDVAVVIQHGSLRRTGSSSTPHEWPMPRHSTSWGLEETSDRLAVEYVRWDDRDGLFGAWIATMTRVVREALRSQPTAEPPATWEAVRQSLHDLADSPTGRVWVADALALSTPAMGMTAERATDLWALVSSGRRGRWTEVRRLAVERIRGQSQPNHWTPDKVHDTEPPS